MMEEYGAHVKLITIDVEWGVLYYDRLLEYNLSVN